MRSIGYLKANLNYTACAAVLGFSRHAIEYLHKKYLETGNVEDLPRVGRPPVKIVNALQEPYKSTRELSAAEGVSNKTIANYAHEAALKFKHFIERPKLTEVHKTLRKLFCEMFKSDNLKQWVFSDECAFQLFRNTQGSWTFSDQIFIEKINSYNTIMIWGAISKKGKSKLYFFEQGERENQEIYKQILKKCL